MASSSPDTVFILERLRNGPATLLAICRFLYQICDCDTRPIAVREQLAELCVAGRVKIADGQYKLV